MKETIWIHLGPMHWLHGARLPPGLLRHAKIVRHPSKSVPENRRVIDVYEKGLNANFQLGIQAGGLGFKKATTRVPGGVLEPMMEWLRVKGIQRLQILCSRMSLRAHHV